MPGFYYKNRANYENRNKVLTTVKILEYPCAEIELTYNCHGFFATITDPTRLDSPHVFRATTIHETLQGARKVLENRGFAK